jgi:hypothetical protein
VCYRQASVKEAIVNCRQISSAGGVRRWAAGVLACGCAVGVASIDLATSSTASGTALPVARAASPQVQEVNQTVLMSVASIQGNTIIAHGQEVTGQLNGVVSFVLKLLNGSHVSTSFTVYNNGHIGNQHHHKGTVEGTTDGHYHVSGAVSSFSGQIVSMRGTEDFAHAKQLGIQLSGSLNRRTYQVTLIMKGKYIE